MRQRRTHHKDQAVFVVALVLHGVLLVDGEDLVGNALSLPCGAALGERACGGEARRGEARRGGEASEEGAQGDARTPQ